MGTLRTRPVFNGLGLRLIAVESVEVRHRSSPGGCQSYGSIRPIAVVVCRPEGTYALDMEAKPADLDQLRRELPELDAKLASSEPGQSSNH